MRYNAKTIGMLRKPVPEGNEQSIILAERKLGIRLPESVREWYSEVDGRDVLSKYSNDDWALAPSEFARVEVCGRELVKFLVENQGVCWWGFELNGSDDPPVKVNLDPPPDNLFQYAATFSEFTYVRVFDFDGWYDEDRFLLETREPLQQTTLRWLESRFVSEPWSVGWPGTTNYRFSTPLGRIVIWDCEGQADWILTAPSSAALDHLKREVSAVWQAAAQRPIEQE
jgi:hypothetical protein